LEGKSQVLPKQTISLSTDWKVEMIQPACSHVLDAKLEPLCPRHNKIMRFEASGLPSGTDNRPSYHCGYEGCNVRYDLVNGYFTLVGMPEEINPVEEPDANTLKCEKHYAWLYNNRKQANDWGDEWCCGVEGCKFCVLTGTKGNRVWT
jgi:hypothetical protein